MKKGQPGRIAYIGKVDRVTYSSEVIVFGQSYWSEQLRLYTKDTIVTVTYDPEDASTSTPKRGGERITTPTTPSFLASRSLSVLNVAFATACAGSCLRFTTRVQGKSEDEPAPPGRLFDQSFVSQLSGARKEARVCD